MIDVARQLSANPDPLLRELGDRLGPRRLRLFAAACCRRISRLLTPGSLAVVQLAERYADGNALQTAVDAARAAGEKEARRTTDACRAAWHTVAADPMAAARDAAWYAATAAVGRTAPRSAWDAERAAQVELIRDMAGCPCVEPPGPVEWPAPVREAAEQLYQGNAAAALLLAGLLRDAGYDDLARHFESPTAHPRGCRALDWARGRFLNGEGQS